MTNELKLREAAERLNKARAGTPLDQIYQFPFEGNRLLDYVNVADAYLATLAAREGDEKLFKEAAWFCNEAIKSCDCTSTERIQYEETRDDFLGRLAKALGISTKEPQ